MVLHFSKRYAIALIIFSILQACSSDSQEVVESPVDPYSGSFWIVTGVHLDNSDFPDILPYTDISASAEWLIRFNKPTGNYGDTFEIAYYCAWFYSEYDYENSIIELVGENVWDEGDCIPTDAPVTDYPYERSLLHHMFARESVLIVEKLDQNKISILSRNGEGVEAVRTIAFERTWVQ